MRTKDHILNDGKRTDLLILETLLDIREILEKQNKISKLTPSLKSADRTVMSSSKEKK